MRAMTEIKVKNDVILIANGLLKMARWDSLLDSFHKNILCCVELHDVIVVIVFETLRTEVSRFYI